LIGPTLATSYFGDETKTKEAFRSDLAWSRDPKWRELFGEDAMARVYLTVDLGRFSEMGDGLVMFMHRRGGYVKVNGYRIDPKEVETAIADTGLKISVTSTAGLSWHRIAVCVFERTVDGKSENSKAQQMLVCYVAKSEESGKPGEVCESLALDEERRAMFENVARGARDIILEYMVPKLFVPVVKLPYMTSGKLDRNALLELLDGMDWNSIVAKYALEKQ
jgi:acyl-CoA synthetase (AMP-forming)/AMP-acid ligase II